MFEKILVCLDGSRLSEQILPFVEAQALTFNSQVILFHVVTSSSPSIVEGGATYQEAKDRQEQVQIDFTEATAYMEKTNRSLQAKGIQSQVEVVKAVSVGKAILDYAESNHIDLIAIATHGHGGLGHLVFGNVADHVLRESGLPMLVIRPRNLD